MEKPTKVVETTIRAVSLFSGVGGLELGFEQVGIETVAQVELDPNALGVLRYRFPHIPKITDIHQVGPDSLTSTDLIYGGFPCQDASIAGNRKGFDGDRTSLWWEFVRVIDLGCPEWIIAENVPGLLTVNDGDDFRAILRSLDVRGYGVAWRVLNARSFGLAQDRRRLFIVGHLGTRSAVGVLDDTDEGAGHLAPLRGAGQDVAGRTDAVPSPYGRAISFTERTRKSGRRLEWRSEIACALTAAQSGGRSDIGSVCFNGVVREMLPVERERLAGWPDDWTRFALDDRGVMVEVPKTHRRTMTGNGVAAPVARWLGERLVAVQTQISTTRASA